MAGLASLAERFAARQESVMADDVFQRLYESEINFHVSSFWDCGFQVALGDGLNGWLAEDTVPAWAEVAPWLAATARAFFPDSKFTKENPGPVATINGDPAEIRRQRRVIPLALSLK
jgi:hypothetical protein